MKKSVKALNAFAGLVLAAGLAFSGCSGLADLEDSAPSQTASFGRAAYAATSGMQGSISSVNVTGGKAQGWLNSAYITWSGSNDTVYCDGVAVNSMLTRKIGNRRAPASLVSFR